MPHELSYGVKRCPILDKVNFTIKRGELVCIVGPTGCGKTTFLNCMSKLTESTSGNIYIDGEVANPRKHNLAFVFQEPTALPWLTVEENVAYGMRIKNLSINNFPISLPESDEGSSQMRESQVS